MAEGLFSGLGFQTPEQIRERISKKYQTQERARYEGAAANFAKAGSHAGRMSALGQQLGMTLRGAFSEAPDFSDNPEVVQAQVRQDTIKNIDLNDWRQVAEAGKASLEGEDVQFGTWLFDRANKLKLQADQLNLERAKLADANKDSGWKWKNWAGGERTAFQANVAELPFIQEIDDDENQVNATKAITATAEDLWNARREQGMSQYTKSQAISDASKFAEPYLKESWIFSDKFDMDKYNEAFRSTFNLDEATAQRPGRKAAAKKTTGFPKPPAAAMQQLRADPTPQNIKFYNETFGPGSAERILPKKAKASVVEDDEDPYDIDF